MTVDSIWEGNHFLWSLNDLATCWTLLWWGRGDCPHFNGLWPLCGNLQTLALLIGMNQRLWHSNGGGLGRGFLHSTINILFTFQLPFCGPNVIDHFICDLYLLLELVCTDTHIFGLLGVNSGFICILIFSLLLVSYGIILLSLRTHNTVGQWKAPSTYGALVSIVVSFFALSIFV